MTDQTNNDSGSRRLRREEERRRLLDEQIPRRPIEVPPIERRTVEPVPDDRRTFEPVPVDRSPIERGWRDSAAVEDGGFGGRPINPPVRTLSRRELRERAAGGAGPANGAPEPSVDETWGARTASVPEPPRPDPTPPARPLSRRELRERAESAASTPDPRQDGASPVEAPPGRRSVSGFEAPQHGEPTGRRAARDASGFETPDASRDPSAGRGEPEAANIRRDREEWSRREPVPGPADLETSGPVRPAQPTRASSAESHAALRDENPERPRESGIEQDHPAGDPIVDAPVRVSPQARAAAIRAHAARVQAEQEDAARERYDQLQSRRAPQGDGQPPAGQPPASMWGQRPEPNGAAQPGMDSAAANGYADRPAVRRVVLPPSMAAGTGPSDVPVLGQWQGQPEPQQPQQQQQQQQPQPQYSPTALPQQYQGVPPGTLPTNGQPFATVTMAPSDRVTQTATAPARPATGGPGGPPNMDGSGPLPRWGSVGASWSPTPSSGPNGPAPVAPVSPPTAVLNGARHDEDHDHDDDPVHRHPYTWLHMIVLVLVAFVLGMLIFMLVIKDTTETGAAADVGQVTAALALTAERVGD